MLFTSTSPTPPAKWNQLAQDAMRLTSTPPPHVARAFGLLHTAMFDAWSNYRETERSTSSGDALKQPSKEHSADNRRKAFSYAAYRVLSSLFWFNLPANKKNLFRHHMEQLGYDPNDDSFNPQTPQGIGNITAQLVIDQAYGDGANQFATLKFPGYSDYTGYAPLNTADEVKKPAHWQPLRIPKADGTSSVQQFLAPHWGQVKPFALTDGAQFRPPPPSRHPSAKFQAEMEEVLGYSAHLTDEQKMICEFWMGCGTNLTPPEIWCEIGQFVSHQCKNTEDDDICMFFALGNALRDAGIAAWDCKRAYDFIRPISAIRTLYKGKQIRAWGGPGKGTVAMDGANWLPYHPLDFLTPPFAEYVSGHSTFSTAAAEVLKSFIGSDEFKAKLPLDKGSSFIEPRHTPASPIVLDWDTFSGAAEQAGISRLYGGIHFEEGNLKGLELGRKVGKAVWDRVSYYLNQTA